MLGMIWVSGGKVPVYVDEELYRRAERFVEEQGGFESVEELVGFLLTEILSEEEPGSGMSEEDEERFWRGLGGLATCRRMNGDGF